MTPTRAQADRAARHAAAAARSGATLAACPYRPSRSVREARLVRVWVRAYLAVNPAAGDRVAGLTTC